jgi:hypothetical protein
MDKASPDNPVAQLKEQQAALTQTVDQLKERLSPAALAEAGKATLAAAARSAAQDSSGRPKPWVLIAASVAFALVVTGVVVRIAKRLSK